MINFNNIISKKVKKAALHNDTSVAAIVVDLLENYIKKNPRN